MMGVIVAEIKTKTSKEIGIPKPRTPQSHKYRTPCIMSHVLTTGIKERFFASCKLVNLITYI